MGGVPGLIGLGLRAGKVVVGTAGVRAGLQRGRIRAVVVACDAGKRTREKVVRLALAQKVPVLETADARALGRQLGRAAVQAIGIRDTELARGLRAQLPTVK